jgi:hydrogenase maturation protease
MVTDVGRNQADPSPDGPGCELAVIGCGIPGQADDEAGLAVIRQLGEDGVPAGVRLVDGAAAGTDLAVSLRGAKRVIVVDSGSSGAAGSTGTAGATGGRSSLVTRIPGTEVEDMPPLSGLHRRSFRWDHALAFARWLLGDEYPSDVTVYLIEAADRTPGRGLSATARDGISQVLGLIRAERAFREPGR